VIGCFASGRQMSITGGFSSLIGKSYTAFAIQI